jgi:hypothetical protein
MVSSRWQVAGGRLQVASSRWWVTFYLLLFTCYFLLLASCQAREAAPPPPVTMPAETAVVRLGVVSSATTLADLAAEAYEADGVFLEFVPGNQVALLADLAAGRLDGLLLHHIPSGNENWFNPVAVDGLVVVVHPDNPLSSLTLGEVQALFNGRITNWSSLGGPDRPVELVSRESGAGTRTLLNQRVLAEQRLDINATIASSDEELLTAVTSNPQAIGYTMMGNGSIAAVKLLAIDEIPPTRNEVGSQRYPLTVPLYFLHGSPDEPQGDLRHFLAWLQSPEGQQVIGAVYGRVR